MASSIVLARLGDVVRGQAAPGRLLLAPGNAWFTVGPAAVLAATGVLMSLPYFKVVDLHPYARRGVDELKLYSVPINGFIVAPAESRVWGGLHADVREALPWAPEMTLLPGFVLIGLALAGAAETDGEVQLDDEHGDEALGGPVGVENRLAEDPGRLTGSEERDVIITPHPGEMARLVGSTIADVQAEAFFGRGS